MNNYFLPTYVHSYEFDDRYLGLFNAITEEIIYCRKDTISINGSAIKVKADIVDPLLSYGMILKEKKTEGRIIASSIKKYGKNLGNTQIHFLYIVPTVMCNLQCTYCHIQHGKQKQCRYVMEEKTLRDGLDIFKKFGGFEEDSEIIFYGGEPFLEVEFLIRALQIIREYSKEIKITIFTNGTLITKEIAKRIKEFSVYVIVSIDGKEDNHNKARVYHDGHGSFEAAIIGYQNLQEHNVAVGISLVAGSHNIETLEQDVIYLVEKFNPLDMGISTLHLFKGEENPNEVMMERLSEKLQLVQIEMRKRGIYIEHIFRKMRPFVEKKVRLYDCPSCNSKLLITPWDTIGFCEAFMEDGLYYYNTLDFDLKECPGREEWMKRIPLTRRDCYSCPAICICGGGCPYDAYCETGSICNKDKRRCKQSRTMIEWMIKELFYMLKENGKMSGIIYIPEDSERSLLYGKTALYNNIPLQNYSKLNEIFL